MKREAVVWRRRMSVAVLETILEGVCSVEGGQENALYACTYEIGKEERDGWGMEMG